MFELHKEFLAIPKSLARDFLIYINFSTGALELLPSTIVHIRKF